MFKCSVMIRINGINLTLKIITEEIKSTQATKLVVNLAFENQDDWDSIYA